MQSLTTRNDLHMLIGNIQLCCPSLPHLLLRYWPAIFFRKLLSWRTIILNLSFERVVDGKVFVIFIRFWWTWLFLNLILAYSSVTITVRNSTSQQHVPMWSGNWISGLGLTVIFSFSLPSFRIVTQIECFSIHRWLSHYYMYHVRSLNILRVHKRCNRNAFQAYLRNWHFLLLLKFQVSLTLPVLNHLICKRLVEMYS